MFHDFGHLFILTFLAVTDFREPIVTQYTKNATLQQQVPVKEETEKTLRYLILLITTCFELNLS